ncbi:MAG: hypothetical protein ACXVFQ_24475 [Solirubrobacteraceae bacterium]
MQRKRHPGSNRSDCFSIRQIRRQGPTFGEVAVGGGRSPKPARMPVAAGGRELPDAAGYNLKQTQKYLSHADLVTTGRYIKNLPVPRGTTARQKLDAYLAAEVGDL